MENNQIKILAVDDNHDNLISLNALISDSFPEAVVIMEQSGKRGIESAKVNDPDVILLDIVMPGMDGFDVCLELKADSLLRDIPVVFLTALKGDKESRIRALECGGEAFLSKPIDETELVAQIRAMVKIKKANLEKRNEKERLETLVAERTRQLKQELEERKRTEKALKESEERFQMLFNQAPLGYQSLDFDGYFIEVNQQWLNTLGYTRDEVVGKWFGDFLSPEYQDGFRKRFPIFKAQGFIHSEFEMVHKNGQKLFIAFEGKIGYDLDGKFKQTHCILQDITQSKKALDSLKESEERFKHIFEAANVGKSITKITGEINVNQAFCNMLGYTKEELKNIKWQEITPSDSIAPVEEILKDLLSGAKNEVRLTKPYRHKDGHSIWADVSVVLLRDAEGKPQYFITTIIDIDEQVKAKKALIESEELNRTLLNGLPESALLIELDGTVIAANTTVAKRIEKTVDELIGKNFFGLMTTEVAEHRRKFARQVIETKQPVQFEDERSGRIIDNRIHPVFDADGKIYRLVVVGIDITERIQSEKLLIEGSKRYQTILKTAMDGYWIVDDKGCFIEVNETYCRMSGYSEQELLSMRIADIEVNEKSNDIAEHIQKIISQGEDRFETCHRRKDGSIFEVEISVQYQLFDNGLMVVFVKDITERKKAETKLKQSYDLLNKLTAMVPGVVYQYQLYPDGRSAFPVSSPGMWDIYEVTPDEVREDASPVFTRLHPDDFAFVVDDINESARNLTLFHCEYRVILPKQGLRWRLCDAKPERLDDGSTLWYGIITDITDRKEAEEKIRESETMLKNSQQLAQIGSFHYNAKSDQAYWSDELFTLYGLSPEKKMMSRSAARAFLHPEDKTIGDEMIRKAFETNDSVEVEYRIIRADGEVRNHYAITRITKGENDELIAIDGTVQDITERKQNEAKLIESEQQYRTLADSGTALIWRSGTDKLCYYFNQPWLNFTGRTFEQEYGNGWAEGVHPDDFDRCLQTYVWAFDRQQSFEMEYRLRHASGEYRWIRDMGTPNYDSKGVFIGYIGHCFDITERKQIEIELVRAKEKAEVSEQILTVKNAELSEKNTFIQTILENLPIGVGLNEITSGKVSYLNKKFQEIYGWDYQDLSSVEQFFEKVYPDEEYRRQLIERVMGDIQSGDPSRMHWENIEATRNDGSKRIINAVNIPLVEQNTMVSTVIDITDLHNIQKDLIEAKEKAEESDRLKSAFLANMSHEIRTPMNSIMGFASLLPDEESKELMANYANIIVRSSEQLVHIIDDIVLYSRLQTKLLSFNPRPFNVHNLLSDVKDSFNLPDKKKGIDLIIETTSEIPVWISSDYEKLRQIFTNLVSNAFKYTYSGSITLGFCPKEKELEFYVRDTGLGIPAHEVEKVFERFYRGSNVNKGVIGGTGLGLSIVKELVELLGGKIWVESEEDEGTTFYFTMPL